MMNGVEVKVAFSGDAEAALGLAAKELEGLGYVLSKHHGGELKMKFDGKWFTTDPAKMKHQVEVTSAAGHLVFAFGTGIIASYWNDSDRAWAQERADAVVKAVVEKLA